MPKTLGADQIRRLRLHGQGLADPRCHEPADVAGRVVGIQAQAAGPARLAVRARCDGVEAGDVDRATGGSPPGLVRTWLMRGTLHMVRTEDLDWLLRLFGPVNIRSGARRRTQLGLTDDICRQALDALPEVLDRPLSRAALVDRLVRAGVEVSPSGQAPAHLMMYAASAGAICRGPDLDNDEPSYVLMQPWLDRAGPGPDAPADRDGALRLLAQRYLAGYGPATVADLAAWSGLPKKDCTAAMAALGDRAVRLDSDLGELVALESALDGDGADGDRDEPRARLLGGFDVFLLGYRSRDLILDPAHAKAVQAGGGMITATAVLDGRVIGTWSTERSRGTTRIVLRPFAPLPAGQRTVWEAEAAAIGRFLREPAELVVAA